jgi:hypothetical protein
MRMARFQKTWIGILEEWIPVMEANCRDVWITIFLPLIPENKPQDYDDSDLREIIGILDSNERDEFRKYAYTNPTVVTNLKTFNPINWWYDSRFQFPSLHFWAFDTLAIPVMSAECERVFSSAKKLITPERSRLHVEIIEASECLKNWWDYGLIKQRPYIPENPNTDDCEP